jgi:hypothetical protein
MTAGEIITSALKRIGAIAATESPSAEDAATGLEALNLLIDQWQTERLTVFTLTRATWTITSGTAAYTVGAGGDVNVTRPTSSGTVTIKFINTSSSPSTEYQCTALTDQAYQAIPQKDLTSPLPTSAYYNPTFGATGLGTITFWPVPTSTTLQGVIYAPAPLGEAATGSTALYLPPGYRRFYVTNLAVELASSFNRPLSEDLVMSARDSKAAVKRANNRLADLFIDQGWMGAANRGGAQYDINSDSNEGRVL